jgi:pterin-4a-carbinolamine dehydratase
VSEQAELHRALADRRHWRREGESLVRELTLRDFEEAYALLGRVAEGVEDHERRPDLCITEFNKLRLTIWNLHHAGITLAEVRLAAKVDAVLDAQAVGGQDRP